MLPRFVVSSRTRRAGAGAALLLLCLACGTDAAYLVEQGAAGTPASGPTGATAATTGGAIDGSGYTYTIPEGWEDVSDHPETAQADSAVRVASGEGFGANINVIVTPAGGATDIEELRDTFQEDVESEVDSEVRRLGDTTIAGEPAIGQTASAMREGERLVFVQYFALHDGSLYAVTMTAPKPGAESGRVALDSVLSSWAWE